MKKVLLSFFLLFFVANVFAQGAFDLEVEQQLVNKYLVIKFFIKKARGTDFPLGISNFALNVTKENLELDKKFIIDSLKGPFDASYDPNSYLSMSLGGTDIVNLTVNVNSQGTGLGQKVTAKRTRVAGIAIPIKNICATNSASWIQGPAAFTIYSHKPKPLSIRDSARFINSPVNFPLVKSISEPIIKMFTKGNLVSTGTGKFQWFYEGKIIQGAIASSYKPSEYGRYSVAVSNGCDTLKSKDFYYTILGMEEQVLNSQILAYPNPYNSFTEINFYTYENSFLEITITDLEGRVILNEINPRTNNGKCSLIFSAKLFGYSSGLYFCKINRDGILHTLKLVELN